MLSDVEFFNSKINKIDGANDLGDHLIRVVKAKTITPETNGTPASIANDTEGPQGSGTVDSNKESEKVSES
jgi:vacuolar protein sorting-associated protein 54